ncbi:hypothetical protein TRFO_07549 [Tritrichomonas foetus]|uniref:Uncharacterized protein n=1 Tax=Tritrichomonas foetus TaxID=1144522 RepID=A0A1J4JQ90_9EUKA|nr:hypothetical protein TRFO_07549 [Tritrichomonas foetus]|eukprot:OHT01327.1 hypothetical protein TRFO_07549 [Tritrichomonas foetus]
MIRVVGPFIPFGSDKFTNAKEPPSFKLNDDGVELCWSGYEIIWSKNRCLLHHLTMPGLVMDGTLCTIDNRQFLAVLYQSGLTLFSVSGQSYLIAVPFQIDRIFALHKALLLYRSQNSALMYSQYEEFPILFTLFHPLEEIRPVAFFTPISSSPLPKFTTIPSPNRRPNFDFSATPPLPQFTSNSSDTQDLHYITDLNFSPLQISSEHCYLLAAEPFNESVSIWKFNEPQGNRDLLFTSPHFMKSPSIFSPPSQPKSMLSPGAAARADLKATLEGIPPDLFMEMIFEFNHVEKNANTFFMEISEGETHLLLILNGHKLEAIDISYIDSSNVVFTIEDVESICVFKGLMFFVVYTNHTVVLHEGYNGIVHLPLTDVVKVQKLGRKFVAFKENDEKILFSFELTFDPVIRQILEVSHLILGSPDYETLILSLSESSCLSSIKEFIPTFIDLFITLFGQHVPKFIEMTHFLFEEIQVQKDKKDEAQKLADLLIPLAKFAKLPQYILYYTLHSNHQITLEEDIELSGEITHVPNIMNWCSQCISGKAMDSFPSPFKISKKLVSVFSHFHHIHNVLGIVVHTEKSKLTLDEISHLQPAISTPLKRAFQLTADDPPPDWPLAAYRLIGREDIAVLQEYTAKPTPQNILFYQQPDLRFLEVERLLQSHLPLTVDVERPNGTDDIQFQSMLIQKLKILLAKQWSLSVGRGLFNLGTFQPLPSQNIHCVEINTSGFTENAIELKVGDDFDNAEHVEWPQFHNGTADGMTVTDADHSWLLDAATQNMTPYYAGVLFGFGLTGLLKKFWKVDLYQYLTTSSVKETNAVALLLGLGISYRGMRDLGISHMLTLHIPELRQFQQTDYDLSPLVESAAILGIAFLFESSGHRHITETFLSLMERSAILTVPAQPFALGTAIGLVNLALGDESSVLRENRERLCVIFSGNKSVDVSSEKTATFGNSDFFAVAPVAVLALTLGYMRTDHSRVKLALSLPNDADFVNSMLPDIVLMRTMGSLMIDSDPNTALNFSVPSGLNPEILAATVTGFAIACGVKFAGTLNLKAFARLQTIAKCLCLLEKTPFDFTDCPVMRREQSLCLVILACSLIKAGTCDVEFLRFIRFVRRRAITTSFNQFVYGLHMTLGMAIGVLNIGKGRYTLSRNNAASAAILIALFPRFTRFPSDNDFFMQPLRHLLNVAAVPRVIEIRDVETNEIVPLYLRIGLKDGNELLIKAPHVLPPYENVTSLKIDDSRYFTVNLADFPFTDEKIRPIIWVKKRSGTEKNEICSLECLRTIMKMRDNKLLSTENIDKDEETDIIKTKNELEWDNCAQKIVEYFRCESVARRIEILKEQAPVKEFLKFYGIEPSATMKDACFFDDDALAFLLPHLDEPEINLIMNS